MDIRKYFTPISAHNSAVSNKPPRVLHGHETAEASMASQSPSDAPTRDGSVPSPMSRKSYSEVVGGRTDGKQQQVGFGNPNPARVFKVIKGKQITIGISDDLYAERVRFCEQTCLIGKIMQNKGSKHCSTRQLAEILATVWQLKNSFRLIALGKGFFTVQLGKEEDKNAVMKRRMWNIPSGLFRLQPWVPDFDPTKATSTIAQVWVRIHDLRWEFWHPEIIMGIAHSLGTPLRIDDNTLHGSVGMFARVLIDIDMQNSLPEKLLLESKGFSGYVHFVYERLPSFCRKCNIIGHFTAECRRGDEKDRNQGLRVVERRGNKVQKESVQESSGEQEGSSAENKSSSSQQNPATERPLKSALKNSNKSYVDVTVPLKDAEKQTKSSNYSNKYAVLGDEKAIGVTNKSTEDCTEEAIESESSKAEETIANLQHKLHSFGVATAGKVVVTHPESNALRVMASIGSKEWGNREDDEDMFENTLRPPEQGLRRGDT